MDTKKITLILLSLFVICGFALAHTQMISDYSVAPEIPLNQEITATGMYTYDGNAIENVQCHFYFFDDNPPYTCAHGGCGYYTLVAQASDDFTTASGRFSMKPFKIVEPTFTREHIYRLRTECGNAQADFNFLVIQKQELGCIGNACIYPQGVVLDAKWWLDPVNMGIMLFVAIFGILAFAYVRAHFRR